MNKQNRDCGRSSRRENNDKSIKILKPFARAECSRVECEEVPKIVPRTTEYTPSTRRSRLKNGCPLNRACMVTPERHDVGQLTPSFAKPAEPSDHYHKKLYEQYGFDPVTRSTSPVRELKNVLCGISTHDQVEIASQYANPGPSLVPNFVPKPDDSPWQTINTIDEIEQFIEKTDVSDKQEPNIRISDVPRVTVVAEKFTRLKKDDIEVRKLDTRIVCIEYDIFNENTGKPIQQMRAFFSVKPARKQGNEHSTTIPSEIRKRFKLSEIDMQKLSEKEIEFIDGKVAENKSYLDDLRRVLKKKQAVRQKKNKNSLDLLSMYHIAKRDNPHSQFNFSNSNLLSKAELDDVKELILQRCDSTANNGVGRRKVRRKNYNIDEVGVLSESIFLDLLREQGKK